MLRAGFAYAAVGIGGAVAYLILLGAMVEWLGMDPVVSSVIAYIPVIISSYYLSHGWVFRSDRQHQQAVWRYLLVIGSGFLINTAFLYMTVHLLDWWYVYGQALAFGVVATSNFMMNYLWTFRTDTAR